MHGRIVMKPLKAKVSITLDEQIIKDIKKLAELDDRSFSQYINIVLNKHLLERNMGKKKKRLKAFFYSLFTIYIPTQTSIKEIIPKILNTFPSFNITADSITPHTGFKNPKTATFPTGLYLRSIDHSE